MLNPAICAKCFQPNEQARTHCWKCMHALGEPPKDVDFMRFFELPGTWGRDELKLAYHRCAKKFHPDANPGNREADAYFKFTNLGYEILVKVGGRKGPPPGERDDATYDMNFDQLTKELKKAMYDKAEETRSKKPPKTFEKLTRWFRSLK